MFSSASLGEEISFRKKRFFFASCDEIR